MDSSIYAITGVVLGILIVLACIGFLIQRLIRYHYVLTYTQRSLQDALQEKALLLAETTELKDTLHMTVNQQVAQSIKAQRSTIKGQLAEQFYPLLEGCPYLPSDMRFIGAPIDYIIFNGYTDTKDGDGQVKEVVFAEIKTGNATLSRHQRSIRDAIERGAVRWETIVL